MATAQEVNANKQRYGRDEALALLSGVRRLFVAKGKKVTDIDLSKDRPDEDVLAGLMLGPTGNLRAPAIRRGGTLFVGFNDELYAEHLA